MGTDLSEKFDEIYRRDIEPKLESLEKYRIQEGKKYKSYQAVCSVFFVISLVCFVVLSSSNRIGSFYSAIFFVITFFSFVIFAFTLFQMRNVNNDFRRQAKELFLGKILSVFGKFRVAKSEIISLEAIKKLGFYSDAISKTDDDNIIGEYKGNPVTFIETKLTHIERDERRSRCVTVFKGLILVVKFKKKFSGKSVLYDRNDRYAYAFNTCVYKETFNSSFGTWERKKLEKVELEDVDFNRKYDVFSDDQVESRFILTPSFMEKIKDLQSRFGARNVNFVFDDGELYLFLNHIFSNYNSRIKTGVNGLFEVGDVRRKSDKKVFKKTFDELVEVFSFIDFINGEN